MSDSSSSAAARTTTLPAVQDGPSRPAENGALGAEPRNGRTASDRKALAWLRGLVGRRHNNTLRDTLEGLMEGAHESEPSVERQERMLIQNVLSLRDLEAVDVMVPRADIVGCEVRTGRKELLELLRANPHSRLPVYRDALDDLLGFIHIKDVVAKLAAEDDFTLEDILRPAMIAAPSIGVLDLLLDMRRNRAQLALIVDEYGGIDGLLTIEDLVEAIVGEIEDEHDRDTQPVMQLQGDRTMLADARVDVEDFEAMVGAVLSEEERDSIDTLGGLVFSIAGRVPVRGELLRHSSGLEFEVLEADSRRIRRLRVRGLPETVEAAPPPAPV